jgi:hypothetical protein
MLNDNNLITVDNCKTVIKNSFLDTYNHHKEDTRHNGLLELERLFQADHKCSVLKLYSIKNHLPVIELDSNRIVCIRYWHQLKFDAAEDITMYLLKYS